MEYLKLGDVVILKSGGPKMTITAMPSQHFSGVMCEWFDRNGARAQARFPAESLKKVAGAGLD